MSSIRTTVRIAFVAGNPYFTGNEKLDKSFILSRIERAKRYAKTRGHLYLNELYILLGLPITIHGNKAGWTNKIRAFESPSIIMAPLWSKYDSDIYIGFEMRCVCYRNITKCESVPCMNLLDTTYIEDHWRDINECQAGRIIDAILEEYMESGSDAEAFGDNVKRLLLKNKLIKEENNDNTLRNISTDWVDF